MREIKFRGKRADGLWVYGDFYTVHEKDWSVIRNSATNERFYVYPDTVGQYTGLVDSNGNKIYEGDLLRFAPPWRWEEDERRIGVVVYKCYGFRIEYSDTSEALFNLAANDAPFTVIGNVHDSPELLGADDERD